MAKKKFGLSSSVNNALTQTAQLAEAESSKFRSTEMLLHRVHLDPENPRNHTITLDDVRNGVPKSDPNYLVKQAEYEGLSELAESIRKDGLLHPIVVIEDGQDYKIVAGERRFLASVIAKRSTIETRVFKEHPNDLDLKIIQWIENQSRRDLSLSNKLKNLQAIICAYELKNSKQMTAIKLAEEISASRSTAQFYMAILANTALMGLINLGEISSYRKARVLCNLETEVEIRAALSEGQQKLIAPKSVDKKKTAGRKRSKILLGTTSNADVAKLIAESVLAHKPFNKYRESFESVDWQCLNESTKAFKKLLGLLEKEVEEKV